MSAISLQYLIPLLAFVAVVGIGGALLQARAMRLRPIQQRLEGNGPELGSVSEHGQSHFYKVMHHIGAAVAPKGPSRGLRTELAKAGFYGHAAPYVFLGSKVLSFVVALSVMLLLVTAFPSSIPPALKLLLVLLGGAFGLMAPNLFVAARRNARQAQVRMHLPDAVDLLEICVSAGMGLDMAWRAVMEQVRRVSTVLADEMSLTDLEINLGSSRGAALRHMADRTAAQELQWLVSAFIQSERFGTSLAETLRTFAASMREERTRRAEEAAEKMAVRILFPLILFIFPTIIIVCAGPAGIKIASVFGGK